MTYLFKPYDGEIKNDSGNPIPINGEMVYHNSTNMQMDAVDRLRVSETTDTWWYAPTIDKDGDYRYIET